jgi:Aminotransferase class-III
LAPGTTNRSASFCRAAKASLFGIRMAIATSIASPLSALNQGHCHPKILAAMVEQAGRLTLTSRAFHHDQLALFYQEIAALTGSHKLLPMNSGAEAVENAIKSVRKWAMRRGVPDGQAEIIVCADSFHGRALGIIDFSTDPAARDPFGPFAAGAERGDQSWQRGRIGIGVIELLLPDVRSEPDLLRTSRVSSYERHLRLENHTSDSCVNPHGFQYR